MSGIHPSPRAPDHFRQSSLEHANIRKPLRPSKTHPAEALPLPHPATRLRPSALLAFTLLAHLPALHAQSDNDLINPDRPGIADGSTTVGRGRFEIESALQAEFRRNGSEHDHTLFIPTLLRYGFAKKWEARAEGNTYTLQWQDDPQQATPHTEGMAPTSAGLKYNFLAAVGTTRPSIGAILRIFPPSGTGDYRNTKTTGDLRLVADWNYSDKWSLNPNLGLAIYQDSSARIFEAALFALTLNFNPTPKLNFFADTGIQTPEQKYGAPSAILDAGTAYIIGRNTQLDLSIGTGVTGTTPPHPFLAAGYSRRF
jgi:hypothetical protein